MVRTKFVFVGSVELIELTKSSIQCPSCLHHVFEGTHICMCGKTDTTQHRRDEPGYILKAPYHRTSMPVTRGSKCGPNPRQQHHHKARDALRSATQGGRTVTSIWDRRQSDEIYRKSQPAEKWSHMALATLYISTST